MTTENIINLHLPSGFYQIRDRHVSIQTKPPISGQTVLAMILASLTIKRQRIYEFFQIEVEF